MGGSGVLQLWVCILIVSTGAIRPWARRDDDGAAPGSGPVTEVAEPRFRASRGSSSVAGCTNPKPQAALFAKVWSKTEWDLVKGLLTYLDTKATANGKGQRPFLFYGTLLGQKRHAGGIPWDDDMDIAISATSWKKMEEVLKADRNIGAVKWGAYWKLFYKNRPMTPASGSMKTPYPFSWPFLDVFLVEETTGGKNVTVPQYNSNWSDAETYWRDWIWGNDGELQNCKFDDLHMKCPVQGQRILDTSYPGWATMCDSGGYDHKKEGTRTQRQKILCSCLGADAPHSKS